MAAAAYREVTHPLGTALWRQVQEQGIQPPRARHAELLAGGAVKAVVDQHRLLIGTRSTLRRRRIACNHCKPRALRYEQLGLLTYYIVVDGRPVGLMAVEEQVRENVEQTIETVAGTGYPQAGPVELLQRGVHWSSWPDGWEWSIGTPG